MLLPFSVYHGLTRAPAAAHQRRPLEARRYSQKPPELLRYSFLPLLLPQRHRRTPGLSQNGTTTSPRYAPAFRFNPASPIDFMQRHNHPGLLRCNKGKCTQNKAKQISLPDLSRTEREKIQPQVVERQWDSPGSIQPPGGKYTNMFWARMPPGARLHQG